MNSGLFGDGSFRLDWSGIGARPGLAPQLVLKGMLTAKGYGIGAVAQVTVEVTAWDIAGTYTYLGTTAPKAWVLNWVRQHHVHRNPAPADEATWDVEVFLPMTPAMIEGLEDRREGGNFSLMLDTSVLLVDRGEATGPRVPVHYATSPTWTLQDRLAVTQHDWAAVLEGWGRGVEVVVVVPIPAVEPSQQRADVVRHIRQARQRIDGGDYFGSFAETRKALELLRGLSLASTPLPRDVRERDPLQRIHAVIDALFNLASASLHTDPAIRDYMPTRADAVAVVAASASVSQQVFASLDRP